MPVLHCHFICSSITSWVIFEEKYTGIEIFSLSSLDVKSGSEPPTFISIYQLLMRESHINPQLPIILKLLGHSKLPKILYKILRFI